MTVSIFIHIYKPFFFLLESILLKMIALSWHCYQSCDLAAEEIWPVAADLEVIQQAVVSILGLFKGGYMPEV